MVTKKKCFKFHFKNGYSFATYCKYENEAVVAYIYDKFWSHMLYLEVAYTGEKSRIKSIKHERYDQEDQDSEKGRPPSRQI